MKRRTSLPLKDDGTVTLDWEMWAGSEEEKAQLDHLAQLVSKQHPNIRLQLRTAPFNAYFTKLQTEFAAGKQACVVSMQSLRLGAYADLLEPLAAPEGFAPASLDALKMDGKQLALPYDLSPMLLYYNKDAFAKAGVAEPKAGWTIADFEKAAKALSTGGKSGFGMSFSDLHTLSLLLSYNGAKPVTDDVKLQMDSQPMIDAVTWYAGLGASKSASVPAGSAEAGWGETQFVNGNAMMAVDGSWNIGSTIKDAKFKVGIAPLPAGQAGSKTYVANSGFGVAKGCAYKEEAIKAVSVLSGKEAQAYLAGQGRGFPARTEQQAAYEDFLVKQNQDKAADVQAAMSAVKEGLAGGVPLFTTKNWDDVTKLMAQHLLQVYTGAQSAKESLATIQQQGARGQ
ncbi:sugar ABC transporter substrate-binding protein [Nonomuraea africana]|uniref:ABC-type glycerol-3-phosphate transport system substrate-binding protein n=1 Tax=Nonomuraea africana TaxID=46171 RepID=A0ABR9KC45_9ACTN|nr:sugar ABC transporter substrate-binding protein [Nonomuraea africana]MBE1559288.1 ABC-type glycerol-3-phosphate transport system substrate-binding protein [Nonomuraea africana]